ncbi:MAG: pilus assembly protein PilM, partial [Planctomycetes bacterium]|nr:pilus assembly protein PilM [Planctomycetota bacterium]
MSNSWLERLPGFGARKRTQSLIGLDLGSTVIKAVEVTLGEEGPRITAVGRRAILPGEELAHALAALFEEHNFTAKEVVTAVSGRSVVVRHLTAAPMEDPEELRAAMSFEADKLLPFDHEEILMDCQRLERTPAVEGEEVDPGAKRIGVALAACRNTIVDEQYRGVLSVGLVPVAVDVEVFALANAFEFCNGELAAAAMGADEDEEMSEAEGAEAEPTPVDPYATDDEDEEPLDDPYGAPPEDRELDPFSGVGYVDPSTPPPLSGSAVAIADIGATRTQITVIVGGETCFSREIGVGGADMTQAIARRLGIENEEAEELKRLPDKREEEVHESLETVIDDLAGELSLSLDFV